MAKTIADYYREGREANLAGKPAPFPEAKSWQQKATMTGYNEAKDTHVAAAAQVRMAPPTRTMPASVSAHIAEMRRRRNPKNAARVDVKIARLMAKWVA